MSTLLKNTMFVVISATAICMAPNAFASIITAGDAIAVDFASAGGSAPGYNIINSNTTIAAGSVIRFGDGTVVDGVSLAFSGGNGFVDDSASSNWSGTAADPFYVAAADDIVYAVDDGATLTLTFAGLDDSLSYNVRVYSLHGRVDARARSEAFSITNGTGTVGGTLVRGDRWDAATLELGGTVYEDVATDGGGNIMVTVTGGNYNNPFLNAVVLEAVPEPTTGVLTLLGLCSICLLAWRRYR